MDNRSTTVIGLDVSDRWTHVFRTERGSPDEGERSKIRTRQSPLEECFRSLPPASTIILEVGPHSRWIYHLVLSCGMGTPRGHRGQRSQVAVHLRRGVGA